MADPIAPSSITLAGWMEAPLPDSVSWWPQTIGWKILAVVLLIMVIRIIIWRVQIYRFNRYRREARHALQQGQSLVGTSAAQYYFQVIKAIAQHVEAKSAAMYKADFLTYLDASFESHKGGFNNEIGSQWLQVQINPKAHFSQEQGTHIYQLCEMWIQKHVNPKQPKLGLRLK